MRVLLVELPESSHNQAAIIFSRDSHIYPEGNVQLTLKGNCYGTEQDYDFTVDFISNSELSLLNIVKEAEVPDDLLGHVIDMRDVQVMSREVRVQLRKNLEEVRVSRSDLLFFLDLGQVSL